MTPKQRAIEATWDTGGNGWTTIDRERLESRVERAIIAAVEEEREDCRKLAVMHARPFDPFSDPRAAVAIQISEAIAARTTASSDSPMEVKDK